MKFEEFKKLKVGDKVKIVIGGDYPDPDNGKVGIVTETDECGAYARSTGERFMVPGPFAACEREVLTGERYFAFCCFQPCKGPLKVKVRRVKIIK